MSCEKCGEGIFSEWDWCTDKGGYPLCSGDMAYCTDPSDVSDAIGGDGFIQLGEFRVGAYDDNHFSISANPKTAMIFRSDGTKHPGNKMRTDWNLYDRNLTAGGPTNVRFTRDHGIEFNGKWCLGLSAPGHLSVAHKDTMKTAEIWTENGVHETNGKITDYNCWESPNKYGIKNVVSLDTDHHGSDYVQFNRDFRFGKRKYNHLSIAAGKTISVIYSSDGNDHPYPGPQEQLDYNWLWRPEKTRPCYFTNLTNAQRDTYNIDDLHNYGSNSLENMFAVCGIIAMIAILWIIVMSRRILKVETVECEDIDVEE